MYGAAGNDTMIGGAGNDTMYGSLGDDVFILLTGQGADTIGDFTAGAGTPDRIDLTGMPGIYSLAQVQSIATQNGANTVVNFGGGHTLTLLNVTVGSFDASDFIFATPPNSAPRDVLLSNATVAEGAVNGTVVGALSAVDPDLGDTATLSLQDSAGGKFALVGTNLVIAGGVHGVSYNVVVRATDSHGAFYDETLTVGISHAAGNTINGTGGDDLINADVTVAGQPYVTDQADVIKGGAGNDTLYAAAGNDIINGNAGDDTLHGGDNNDYLVGSEGNDLIYGDAGSDTVDGGAGNDVIDGGTGADSLRGNAGDDIYYLDATGDAVAEVFNEGLDEVRSTVATQFLAANVENLTGLSTAGQRLGGNALDNLIIGSSGNDIVTGDAGNDTIFSGAGNDTLNGNAGDDTLHGGDNNDYLVGSDGNDMIYGDAGNDTVDGGAGNDIIDGGTGVDSLRGNGGDDVYYLDNPGDAVSEQLDQGIDEVRSTNATQFIATNVEKLTGLSASGQRLGGNALDNVITGNAGNDTITGDAGNDTISGAGGNDAINGNAGDDLIQGGAGADYLTGGLGNDIFAFTHADFQAGAADRIVDFHETVGTDYDILRLQGTAADYTVADGAGYALVTDHATGGSIVIVGMTASTLADQIEYVA